MKKKLLKALAILLTVSAFTSCSDDNNDTPIDTTPVLYTASDEAHIFKLTVNGDPMVGKQATYTPDGSDRSKGTITLTGMPFSLSALMGTETAADDQPVSQTLTCGVFPGSASTTIQITKGANGVFSGSDETEFCTFDYVGSITDSEMQFIVSNLKLRDTSLCGTKLVPTEVDEWGSGISPIYFEWIPDETINIAMDLGGMTVDMPLPIKSVLALAISTPMIKMDNTTVSMIQALQMALHSVTLREDGSVIAQYSDPMTGITDPLTTPPYLATYVVLDDSHMKAFIDPTAVIASLANPSSQRSRGMADMMGMLAPLLGQVDDLITNGVTICYRIAPNGVRTFYLPTEFLLPIFKSLAPALADEEVINKIIEAAAQDPSMQMMASMIPSVLQQLPAIIDKTTTLELGLNLKPEGSTPEKE